MTIEERDRLTRVEEKLDHIIDQLKTFQKCHDDHENRIRTLESKPGKMWGILTAAIITGIAGAVIGAVFATFVK